jgi:hypothetical protein
LSEKIENINLKDLEENTQNYLGEIRTRFTIVEVTPREDPHHRLIETYYLVHIKDPYGNKVSFVISKSEYSKYSDYVGKVALFKLSGSRGPELMHPPDRLITNILVSKQADPHGEEYYRIFISLIDK